MSKEVFLTEDAQRDLTEIFAYIAEHDGPEKAEHVLERIGKAIEGIANGPLRGSYPKELAVLGIRDYRQVFFKPYRAIYRVVERRCYVYLAADGRRDMPTLLAMRLFLAP